MMGFGDASQSMFYGGGDSQGAGGFANRVLSPTNNGGGTGSPSVAEPMDSVDPDIPTLSNPATLLAQSGFLAAASPPLGPGKLAGGGMVDEDPMHVDPSFFRQAAAAVQPQAKKAASHPAAAPAAAPASPAPTDVLFPTLVASEEPLEAISGDLPASFGVVCVAKGYTSVGDVAGLACGVVEEFPISGEDLSLSS